MAEAFIIMQLGNPDLDRTCGEAIVPAIESCGLDAKRVDKHNQGGLLKSEIIGFIERSSIIVADLTNERPNCYLEIGYAMGLDKFRNIILTAREDHNPESPNYVKGKGKVHFDLSGYDILFWNQDNLAEFHESLRKRILRRMTVLAPVDPQPAKIWDEEWINVHKQTALPKLQATGKSGYMDVRFALNSPKPNKSQGELDEAARNSNIETFGWPIAIYIREIDAWRPRPKTDGIIAEIANVDQATYDYWAIRRNGDFYLLKTIFEDVRDSTKLFFNTRISRVTEVLLYCARLYKRLDIDPTTIVHIAIQHGGLKDRIISSSTPTRFLRPRAPSVEDTVESTISSSLEGLETNLVNHVKQLTAPIFMVFDFFEVSDQIYEEIINAFVEGQIK